MKRLVKKSEEYTNLFLGSPIEIINSKSKYFGYRGWVDGNLVNNKYKIFINPNEFENKGKPIIIYINFENIHKWVRLIPIEALGSLSCRINI